MLGSLSMAFRDAARGSVGWVRPLSALPLDRSYWEIDGERKRKREREREY